MYTRANYSYARRRLCGSELPDPISSSGNEMIIYMRSDNTVSSRGFKARWDSEQTAGQIFSANSGDIGCYLDCKKLASHLVIISPADCGGRVEGTSGVLSPPTVDDNYTNNTLCKWTYVNPNPINSTVVLSMPSYFLQDTDRSYCWADWIQVIGKNAHFYNKK